MDNQTLQKIKDLLAKYQNISIVVAANPSIDQMGAGLGLYLVLQQAGKNVNVVCPTPPTVEISSLVGINKLQTALNSNNTINQTGDLIVSFPYQEGEIEKVSYTLDSGQLNIVVKAGAKGLSFSDKDVSFKRSALAAPAIAVPLLIFAIGVSRLADLGNTSGASIINIDNKTTNENYGEVIVVAPKFSSVSEQVADFLTLMEPQINIDADAAQNMLSGIAFATNDFTTAKTSYLAFEMAGILMRKGAVRSQRPELKPEFKPDTNMFFPSKPVNVQPQPQPQLQPNQVVNNSFTPPVQFQQPIMPMNNTFMPSANPQPATVNNTYVQPNVQPRPDLFSQPAPAATPQPAIPAAPSDWLSPKVYKGSTIL